MTLKILHVIQSVDPRHGGPIEGIRQQAKAHKVFGHSVEIVSLDRRGSEFLDFPQVKVYPVRKFYDSIFCISLFLWICKNAQHYDGIIINGVWGFHLLAASLASKRNNVPYFIFAHGMLDPWFKFRYPLKHIKKWLVWPWSVYPCLRDASAVFFTCAREAQLARNSFWLYDCNEAVIKYGTDGIPDFEYNYASEFLSHHPSLTCKQRFLFLGRVHPKKGPDILVRAISQLQREGLWKSNQMVLVLAGPNDGPYARSIVKLATRLGVLSSIYWTGMITGSQKWGAFQSSDAFVLPSHQENFGIAVAEALSCGLPVLTTHPVNISPEIVADGAGFVETDTLIGCVQLFKSWFKLSTESRSSMRSAALDCFRNRYHISHTSPSITRYIFLAKLENMLNKPCVSKG